MLRLRGMRRSVPVLLATFSLLLAACGGDAGGDTTTTTAAEDTTTTTAPATTTTTEATTTTSAADTTTTTVAPGPTTLPGEEIEFGPADGDVVMVAGVRYDDVLNLRAAPGPDHPIRDEIPPTYDNLIAEGHTRDIGQAFWIEVDYDGTLGWVHMGYIAFMGDVTDETAMVIDELGERPTASSMTALGEEVADVFDSDEEPESDIVQVTDVVHGDLSEVTYDVIGLGDDAVRGFRLHIFAERSGNSFTLRSVEVTLLCGRGISDGACV